MNSWEKWFGTVGIWQLIGLNISVAYVCSKPAKEMLHIQIYLIEQQSENKINAFCTIVILNKRNFI